MAIGETIGGAFLSAFLQVLFDRMSSQDFIHFIQGNESVYDLLKKLKVVALSVNAVLNDAEEKQLRDPAVREWLSELEEAIFEADDLVDQINTRALESNTTVEVTDTFSEALLSFFNGTKRKIEKITARLEFIIGQKDFLDLKEGDHVQARSLRGSPPVPLEDNSSIYGRDEDIQRILELLRSDEVSVISVVGMAGIGKTTLAQIVYSVDIVEKAPWDCRAWITVSAEFDVFMLTKAIYEAVTRTTCHIQELYPLQVQLKLHLWGKKFLLVLDDVWNENYMYWNALKSPLESGAPGSKIIVTTRSEKVASMMSNASMHRLQEISEECSWSLFAKHAFNETDLQAYPDLKSVAEQVVKKCQGLPLAIKALGGLLRSKVNIEEWKKILTSDIWELNEKEHNILPALWLSYYHLPPYLKRCFAYCSIFPKNHKINEEQLVSLWMAEDLLHPSNGRRMEDVGEDYIHGLVSRSLFQRKCYNPLTVTMHELVHDLATFVSRGFCRRLDCNDSPILESKTRYLSIMNGEIFAHEGIKKFELLALSKGSVLRSFLASGTIKSSTSKDELVLPEIPGGQRLRVISLSSYGISKFPRSIGNFKHLRYFDFSCAQVKEIPNEIGTLLNMQTLILSSCSNLTQLPKSIGNLKHLRYLDLSRSMVNKLPDTICDLSNLQTLLLSDCKKLTRLPMNMGRLTGLRHLSIARTSLEQMPPQMSELKNLQTLTNFVVGEGTTSNINELRELQHVQGCLAITGLQNVIDGGNVLIDNLKDKKHLGKLLLKWKSRGDELDDEKQVLEKLQPHANLKELTIENYNGRHFPNWVADGLFSKMVMVSLIECKHCTSLPPLGQLPSLTRLEINGFEKLEIIGAEFYSDGPIANPFQSLKFLHFEKMYKWHTWSLAGGNGPDEAFPCLEQVVLHNCRRLPTTTLPEWLQRKIRSL